MRGVPPVLPGVMMGVGLTGLHNAICDARLGRAAVWALSTAITGPLGQGADTEHGWDSMCAERVQCVPCDRCSAISNAFPTPGSALPSSSQHSVIDDPVHPAGGIAFQFGEDINVADWFDSFRTVYLGAESPQCSSGPSGHTGRSRTVMSTAGRVRRRRNRRGAGIVKEGEGAEVRMLELPASRFRCVCHRMAAPCAVMLGACSDCLMWSHAHHKRMHQGALSCMWRLLHTALYVCTHTFTLFTAFEHACL